MIGNLSKKFDFGEKDNKKSVTPIACGKSPKKMNLNMFELNSESSGNEQELYMSCTAS